MVRTRSHEASLVALLAGLAAFCALEAQGGQPYTVVGQSSKETAATGRRPLGERIKAANRPIRIAAEEALAPDSGLIPELSAGLPGLPERDWTPPEVVVERPEGMPLIEVASEEIAPSAPAVVPPPEATPLATNPTSSEVEGFADEVSSTDPVPAVDSQPALVDTKQTTEESPHAEVAAPARMPATPQAGRMPPPRRAVSRVTPQRREALLARLRTALAEMPRPLGLVPATPKRSPAPRPSPRPHAAVGPEMARIDPQPEASVGEAAVDRSQSDLSLETVAAEPAEPTETPSDSAGAPEAIAETQAPVAIDVPVASMPAYDPAICDDVVPAESRLTAECSLAVGSADPGEKTDPVVPAVPDDEEGQVVSEAAPAAGSDGAEAELAAVDASGTVTSDEATVLKAEPTAVQAPLLPRPTTARVSKPSAQRSRPPAAILQRHGAFDRLQARLEAMPRPLGLLPAPRPSMHAATPRPRPPVARGGQPTRPAVPAAVTREADQLVASEENGTEIDPQPAELADVDAEAIEATDAGGNAGLDAVADAAEASEVVVASDSGAADTADPATLASGNTLHDETMPIGDAVEDAVESEVDGVPATLAADAATEDAGEEVEEVEDIATACIEVTVASPEEAARAGEQVTIQFTIRNTGTAPAAAVTPVIHFAAGLEPVGMRGRHGRVTADGSVVFDRVPELAAGETIEVAVIATCTSPGTVSYQGVAWCGEGASAEQVPVVGDIQVVPARLAAEPPARRR